MIALAGGWLGIAVEDNARARPHAFDFLLLFESTKRELPRLGLALLAGEIVAAHGGRLLARPAMRRDEGLDPDQGMPLGDDARPELSRADREHRALAGV